MKDNSKTHASETWYVDLASNANKFQFRDTPAVLLISLLMDDNILVKMQMLHCISAEPDKEMQTNKYVGYDNPL